jgi:hypothetical protein
MLREPAEMLYSLYYQFRFDGNEDLPTFEEALQAEDQRRAGHRLSRGAYFAQGLVYRDAARYTAQVRRYFDVFGRRQVLVLLYDEFSANPAAAYRQVLDFLGLDSTRVEIPFKAVNASKAVRSKILRGLLTEPWLRRAALGLRPCLPQPVFRALRYADARLRQYNTRLQQRPPMPAQTRTNLKKEFAPEVEQLGRLIGRDLSHWSS